MDNNKDLVIISDSTRLFIYGHTVHPNKKLAKIFQQILNSEESMA